MNIANTFLKKNKIYKKIKIFYLSNNTSNFKMKKIIKFYYKKKLK